MADPLLGDLAGLLCFARVVEHGSFTRAAATLGLSKSVVSTRIAALEARLGEPLLLRTTRRVSATATGARIYAHAKQMVEAGAAATSAATDAARGVLRVSAPVTLAQLYLASPVTEFLARNPAVRIELLLEDRVIDLIEDRIDLAIRVAKLGDSELVAKRLAATPMHVCAAPAYLERHGRPTRPEHLIRHNCLRYTRLRAEHEWRFYGDGARIELEVGGNFATSDGTMLREAAIAGLGIAILPRFMIGDAIADGRLEVVLAAFAPRPLGIYAVRSGKRTASRLTTDLVRALELALRDPPWR